MTRILLVLVIASALEAQGGTDNVPGFECSDCHSERGWTNPDYSNFNHEQTGFGLDGVHRIQRCQDCHRGESVAARHQFRTADAACSSCHVDVHQDKLGGDCQQCHSTRTWQVDARTFDHETTRFSLRGAHAAVACQECHRDLGGMDETPMDCWSCHSQTYTRTRTPDHERVGLDEDCTTCHDTRTRGWVSRFDHETQTAFSLSGAHIRADCAGCHQGQTRGTAQDCWSCHASEYNQTGTAAFPLAPEHSTELYDQDCSICHTTERWQGASFDHDLTDFPLEGAHVSTNCGQCHGSGNYQLESTCEACHVPGGLAVSNFLSSDFDHETHNLATECQECHTQAEWDDSVFEHDNFSGQECSTCHEIEHTESEDPPHANGNIGLDCVLCHGNEDWEVTDFAHDQEQTGYPLTGRHLETLCENCHAQQVYRSTPTDCADAGCHLTHYEQTSDPDHQAFGYPVSLCENCHTPAGWSPHQFTHAVEEACATCHLPDYQGADNPVHDPDQGFGPLCEACHTSTSTWEGALFSHDNVIDGCVVCHQASYESASSPPHAGGNISNLCENCHATTSWSIDQFAHSSQQTSFPLVGLHQPVDCDQCHLDDVYNGTPTSCEDGQCHLPDYQNTSDPDHQTFGYPVSLCSTCHTESGWEPHQFQHTVEEACATCHLPDYESASEPVHNPDQGFTQVCEDCHSSTTTWEGASFNHSGVSDGCVNCHLTDYENADNPVHDPDLGFTQTCENCHSSTDTWEGASFDHGTISDGCNTCHAADYQATTNPSHIQLGYPQTCELCHQSTTDWTQANFSHDFPIAPHPHQHERTETCLSCHPNENMADFTCFGSGCHSVSGMVNEHCENGPNSCESCNGNTFPYTGVTSQDCYTCHPNGDEDDCEGGDGLPGRPFRDWHRNQR